MDGVFRHKTLACLFPAWLCFLSSQIRSLIIDYAAAPCAYVLSSGYGGSEQSDTGESGNGASKLFLRLYEHGLVGIGFVYDADSGRRSKKSQLRHSDLQWFFPSCLYSVKISGLSRYRFYQRYPKFLSDFSLFRIFILGPRACFRHLAGGCGILVVYGHSPPH